MTNYSNSKCPKCDNNTFESVIETPYNSKFKLQFIRCEKCRTVISAIDYHNIGYLIERLAMKLGFDIFKN